MAKSRLCSLPDCGKPHDAYGYCRAHGARWKRHGDPLAGGKAFPPRGEIEDFFRTKVLKATGPECLLWPYSRTSAGYGEIFFNGRRCHVHRLACEHANGPAPTPEHEAAHNCGKGHEGCVTLVHLEWKTAKQNAADRKIHGTDTFGERNGNSILTELDVREIRTMWPTYPMQHIGDQFGVTPEAIWLIIHRKNWAWLD